ncbi:MAG: hypothetical protein AzoDbin1_02691 [Azoarcus sp.]|nr:hypothetical protein [Azoarcus sp.]
MKPAAQTTFAERVGRALGRVWRSCMRLDREANGWLLAQGLAPGVAKAALLVAKLVAVGLLVYAAFWLALLVTTAMAATWMASQQDSDDDSDFLGRKAEERDHREGLFYHPTSHNDDPDPRFEDD